MAVSALELDKGTAHGRIPVGDAAAGVYVYELGHAFRAAEHMAIGDQVLVFQATPITYSSTKLLRTSVRVKAPRFEVPGARWLFRAYLAHVATGQTRVYYERVILGNGRELLVQDIALSTRDCDSVANTQIVFSLSLVAV